LFLARPFLAEEPLDAVQQLLMNLAVTVPLDSYRTIGDLL
jgi:hypothetical protein